MSLPLGPTDIFSAGCRPSQTARLVVSPPRLAALEEMSSVTLAINLLPPLCILLEITTTSCSKGLQGLRFPLDVTGLFTGKLFSEGLG